MRIPLLTLFLFFTAIGFSQINDCVGAEVICSDDNIAFNPMGAGIDDYADPDNEPGCIVALESNSAWYYFEIDATAPPGLQLGFIISPNGGLGEDYDWALYGPDVTCGDLGFPLRCSSSSAMCGFCPETGMGMGAMDTSEGPGSGDGFVAVIDVLPGQGYYLMIDNWLGTMNGFMMSWTGTAAPYLNCSAEPPCGIVAQAGGDITACENDPSFLLNGNSSGGQGNETYLWVGTNGGTGFLNNPSLQSPTVTLPPGFTGTITYTLTVTEDGCISEDDMVLTVNALPAVSLLPAGPLCQQGQSISLNANPPGGTWTGAPGGIFNPQTNGPGTHTVTYTYTANNCTNSASIDIIVNSNPTVSISPDPASFCTNDGGVTLTASGAGGLPGYTYAWSSPLGDGVGATYFATTMAPYIVIATDANGCTATEAIDVTENQNPLVLTIDPGPLCESINSYTLMGSPNGGTWTGSIVTGGGEIYPSGTGAGTYTVTYTYTDVNGCPGSDDLEVVIIPPPFAIPTNNGPYCAGQTIELFGNTDGTGNIVSYFWIGPNNFSSTLQNPITATDPGVYSLQVTIDGCASDFEFTTVTVTPMPDALALNDGPYCPGQTIQLNGFTSTPGNNISYSWTGPNGYISFSQNPMDATESGIYELIVNVDGCESAPVTTEVSFNNAPDATANNTGPYCLGENIVLSATTNTSGTSITYSWTGPNGYVSMDQNPIDATEAGTYSVIIDVDGCTSDPAETTITINALPDPVITGDNVFCQGNSVTIDAGVFAGYEWNDGSNNQTLVVNSNGTFSVTVTDVNGCTGEDQFTVTQNNNPTPNIAGPAAFCAGASITLDAGGNYDTYLWNDNSTNQTLAVNTGGTYSVTVTDSNGCTGEDQQIVTENSATPPAITGTLEFCDGGSSTLDAGTYNAYLWTGGSSNQTLNVNATGDYSVTVTDANGCTAEDMVSVTVNDNPTLSISGVDAFCAGASSTLDAGTFDAYLWTDGSTNQTLDVSTSGTYGVTVTDGNGCTGEDDINITVNPNPTPTIGGSTSFCAGSSTTLNAGNGYDSYLWSDGSGNQTLTVSTSGNYSVTVTNANGCTGEDAVMVQESTSLNPVITGDLEYCVGGSTILDAGTGFSSYLWTDGSSNQTITVTAPGNYAVTVSDGSGCSGETSVNIIENNLPSFSITGNNPICTGDNITLDAGGGFDTYAWSNMSLNQTILVSSGGAYSVTITDANGCSNEDSVDVIENPNPVPVITGDQSFCTGETVTLDAGVFDQYNWSDGSGNATLDISTGGAYSVTVTDANSCTGEDQITITQNQLPVPTINGNLDYCAGTMTSISVNEVYVDYNWSNGGSTQAIDISTPGNIDVIVTDANGCTGTTSVNIIENQNPTPTISGSTTFCTGTSTTIDAGAGYVQYLWSNGSANQTLLVDVPGTYDVTVTDVNGCTGSANIMITESQALEPIITGNLILCEGENSILDAGAGFSTYLWSTGDMTQTIDVNATDDYTVTVSDTQGCTGESAVSLVVNPNPVAQILGDDIFCTGEIVTLDAGGGFETYTWSDGSDTQTIDVTAGNTYSVVVSNSSGCTDETSLLVTENPVPVPVITGPTSFCIGNSAVLDAGAGYSMYEWSNGETTQTVTITAATNISVIVTDANGCTGSDQTSVTENASLTPQITGTLTFCENGNTTLDAGTGFETYLWSNNETTQTITIQDGGSYTVIVTDTDGCSGSDNVAVTEFQNPDPVIAGSTTFCVGGSATLDAGNYQSFLWSDGSTTQTITVNTPGTYSVEVTNINGCVGQASTDVTESTSLNPVISGGLSFCENENTILDAGAGFDTYLWSDGSTNQTYDVSIAGNYSVTVSDGQGCTGETTVTVTEIAPPVATLQNNTSTCNTTAGGSVLNLYDLVLSGDMNGTWTDADNSGAVGVFNNLNFNNIPAGDYNFIYTTNSAIAPCAEISYPVTVTVIDCTCPDVLFFPADPLCNASGTLDLTTIENTTEDGTWTIIQSPAGANPATVSNDLFDATGSDVGDYTLQFELTNTPPPGCPTEYFVSITVDPTVEAGSVVMAPAFCQADDEIVDLSALIAGADANGIWTETSAIPSQGGAFDPANADFATVAQSPGVYTFMYAVTSPGVCPDDEVEVSVTINQLPTAIAGSTVNLDCLNPSNNLNGAGSSTGAVFEVTWTGPGIVMDGNENTLTPTIDAPGMYELSITNTVTGCAATDIVQVTDDFDNPQVSAGNDQTLDCNDVTASLQASGDINPPFQILWEGPGINAGNENDPAPTTDLPGTYTITISNPDNGCSSIDTVVVFQDTDPPTIVIQSALEEIDCTNPTADLISDSPTPNVTYEWFDFDNFLVGNTASVSNISQAGTYTVVVTSLDNGCTNSDIIIVQNNISYPDADAGNPDLLTCLDTEATLDGSASESGANISYLWNGPGVSGPADQVMTMASLPGIYTLTVINTDNGCTSTDQVEINEDILLPTAFVSQPEQLDCTVEEVTLDGTGSSTGAEFIYSWLDAGGNILSTNLVTTIQDPGAYTLLVINTANGCEQTQTVQVNENTNFPNAVDVETYDPDCFGDTNGYITINEVTGGTSPYIYSINGSSFSTNPIIGNLAPGSYELTVQDANGCEFTTIVPIIEAPELVLDLGIDLDLRLGDTAIVEATVNIPTQFIDTIIWSPADIINCGDSTCMEIGLSTFNTVEVFATVIDINGCTDDDAILIKMRKSRDVFIPNAFSPNDDGYNDRFTVFTNDRQIKSIPAFKIFNRWGELMFDAQNFEANDLSKGWDGYFRGEKMNPGVFIYLVEVEFIDGRVELYKGDVTLVR